MTLLAVDTETTGLDLYHGAAAYLVTLCDDQDQQCWWEWEVDPYTRQVLVPDADRRDIWERLEAADELVLQNAKFDVAFLTRAGIVGTWPWGKTHDTLLAAHLLASNQPHDLTSLGVSYLAHDLGHLEEALKQSCLEARRLAKTQFPDWAQAKRGRSDMPSAKESCWKYDGWLPRQLAEALGYPVDHPWRTVLANYANGDSALTVRLWPAMREQIKRRGYWAIYQERRQLPRLALAMETRGVTLSRSRLRELQAEYGRESETLGARMIQIAKGHGYDLQLPKSGNNKSLATFCFGEVEEAQALSAAQRVWARRKQWLDLPVLGRTATGTPSLDKATLEQYATELEEGSPQLDFCRALADKRSRDTALAYMEGYQRFWLPWGNCQTCGGSREQDSGGVTPWGQPISMGCPDCAGWFVLHPSVNPTGTDTTRWSSSNPNEQNISKKKGFNLRKAFGPAPGREWWSLDAQNIELRLPAYEAGEEEMIALFDRPDDPPFYGSNHMLIFSFLWPQDWAEALRRHGPEVAAEWVKSPAGHKAGKYQWVKNGNFAVQYGAIESSGTADRAYHQAGAQRKVQARFRKITQLNQRLIDFANKHGYVETMPDRTVDPRRGYPLLCSRSEWGKILPTVPLNYHVQGTACWWAGKALVRCDAQLARWREESGGRFDGFVTMYVHDELVFDLPKRGDPLAEHQGRAKPRTSNLWRIRVLQRLMAQGGEDIGVPTPVGAEYHADNWSEGVTL